MPIKITNSEFSYIPIPKVACTSGKKLIFHINNGFDFEETHYHSSGLNIHNHQNEYQSVDFLGYENNSKFKIALVRDPIKRLLSAYTNRVVQHNDLQSVRHKLTQVNLSDRPSIREFIVNLETYRALSRSIAHHTDLQSVYLGPNNKNLSLYRLEDISAFTKRVNEIAGTNISMPHEQTSKKVLNFNDMAPKIQRLALKYCLPDYDYLSEYYQLPNIKPLNA